MPEDQQEPNSPIEPVEAWGNTTPAAQYNEYAEEPLESNDAADRPFAFQPQSSEALPVDTPLPLETVVTPVIAEGAPLQQNAPKNKKKLIIIGAVIAGALALATSAGVLAYNLWYQNPQKVITDAIVNSITAKSATFTGNISAESDGTKAVVDFTSNSSDANADVSAKLDLNYSGKEYKFNASSMYANTGDAYLKVDNIGDVTSAAKSLLSTYGSSSSTDALIDKIAKKIDGTWIKVNGDDLKSYSADYSKAQKCFSDTVTKFKDDKASIAEIGTVYRNNQFIVIKKDLGKKDGSRGYEIGSDSQKTKAFVSGLESTTIYKYLHDCDNTFKLTASDVSTVDNTKDTATLSVWVNSLSHQFTKLDVSSDSNGTKLNASISPVFNKPVTVNAPSSSISLTQLMSDIQGLLQEFTYGSSL